MKMREIFISHASADKSIADKIVSALEDKSISCWIAPRDIPAGSNYGAEIAKGIKECSILILVFSENSHSSTAVFREVQMAFDEKKMIIPLRIQEIPPSDDLSFYLSGLHWLDVSPEKLILDGMLKDVTSALEKIRGSVEPPEARAVQPPTPASAPKPLASAPTPTPSPAVSAPAPASTKNAMIIGASLIVCCVLVLGTVLFLNRSGGGATAPQWREDTDEARARTDDDSGEGFADRDREGERENGYGIDSEYENEYAAPPAGQRIPLAEFYMDGGILVLRGNANNITSSQVERVESIDLFGGMTFTDAISLQAVTGSGTHNINQFALFRLGGEFTVLSGYAGRVADSRVSDAVLTIYADGELILEVDVIGVNLPAEFEVSVEGVQQLRLEITYDTTARTTTHWGLFAYVE